MGRHAQRGLSYELPGRRKIEDAARSVHHLLTANQPIADEAFEQRELGLPKQGTDSQRTPNLSSCSDASCVKAGNETALIVPDGAYSTPLSGFVGRQETQPL